MVEEIKVTIRIRGKSQNLRASIDGGDLVGVYLPGDGLEITDKLTDEERLRIQKSAILKSIRKGSKR